MTTSSIAWDRQNPQFHHHYHYGSQYPGNYPIYNSLHMMSRNGYKVAGIYIATQCIIFLVCCSIFLLVMGAVMTGLGVSIDEDSGGSAANQANPLKVAGLITISMAVLLLGASTMLCFCAYREGMKVAQASRPSASATDATTRSTHAYGEPGNPAHYHPRDDPRTSNLSRQASLSGGGGGGNGGGGGTYSGGHGEIAYIAPLPPPYAHPPTITANIYPSGLSGNGHNGFMMSHRSGGAPEVGMNNKGGGSSAAAAAAITASIPLPGGVQSQVSMDEEGGGRGGSRLTSSSEIPSRRISNNDI